MSNGDTRYLDNTDLYNERERERNDAELRNRMRKIKLELHSILSCTFFVLHVDIYTFYLII